MIATSLLAAAMAFGALADAPPTNGDLAASGILKTQFRIACYSGYHQDKDGNCQPNIPETPRYCASLPGYIYQPTPDSWTCVPAPKGY